MNPDEDVNMQENLRGVKRIVVQGSPRESKIRRVHIERNNETIGQSRGAEGPIVNTASQQTLPSMTVTAISNGDVTDSISSYDECAIANAMISSSSGKDIHSDAQIGSGEAPIDEQNCTSTSIDDPAKLMIGTCERKTTKEKEDNSYSDYNNLQKIGRDEMLRPRDIRKEPQRKDSNGKSIINKTESNVRLNQNDFSRSYILPKVNNYCTKGKKYTGTSFTSHRAMSTLITLMVVSAAFFTRKQPNSLNNHIIMPRRIEESGIPSDEFLSPLTLRQFLSNDEGFHLAMGPAFYGFYGYFGALAAWDEEISTKTSKLLRSNLKSVAGASAGAMAALLLASGVEPRRATDFCANITLDKYADPPGVGSVFKGDKFEKVMFEFLKSEKPRSNQKIEDTMIPVAVSAFDIQKMEMKVLDRGSVSRAARASATFPFLFQPVGWKDKKENYLLIDGGLKDQNGLEGLTVLAPSGVPKRVINFVVGDFQWGKTPGPSDLPQGLQTKELISISLRNLPQAGPWAMENGPLAAEAAMKAMKASMDIPLFSGQEAGHYELHIDASTFVDEQ